MSRSFLILTFISSFLGCRVSFDVSKDALGPFRIAAIGVESIGGDCPVATASIWSGSGMSHSQPVLAEWFLEGESIGSGWDVPVCGEGLLELRVTHPNGQALEAQVDVRARDESLLLRRSAVDLVDLDLESRRGEEAKAVESSVPLGSATRVVLEGMTDRDSLSWMSPPDQGVVLGLGEASADLLAETWTVDEDGELLERTSFSGIISHLALSWDGAGGNRYFWVDAAFGVPEEDLLRHEGRLVLAPGLSGITRLTAKVKRTPEGFELTELGESSEFDEMDLDCAGDRPYFLLDWIPNGRCALSELDDQRIILEVW